MEGEQVAVSLGVLGAVKVVVTVGLENGVREPVTEEEMEVDGEMVHVGERERDAEKEAVAVDCDRLGAV